MNLLRAVTLDRASRRKDKSVSLTFITQTEQSSEEFMEIDNALGDSGVLYFKPNGQLTTEEVKELDNVEIEVEGKTKSQRLRNVLYVLWGNGVASDDDFNNFYSNEMEKIIQHYKDKLD
jgi:hypothetical protein|tara:strand:- start:13 stop:369 length:357 start_codon:yes stop_codon:yes gene_type:complete